jgi:hypothetical protein
MGREYNVRPLGKVVKPIMLMGGWPEITTSLAQSKFVS